MPFGGEDAESYYDDGLTASMKGDLRRAAACFEKALARDPAYVTAAHQLGKCYYRMGQANRAVDLLQRVVTRKPDLAAARLDLGYALLSLGKVQEARSHFQQIIAVDPLHPRARLGMAQAAFDSGEWAAASAQARLVEQNGAANFSVLYLLGRAAKLAGNPGEAHDALTRAEKLMAKSGEMNPGQPEAHFLRGEVCFVQDQFATALEHYRVAEDRAKDNQYYTAFGENFTRLDILAKQGLCFQRLGETGRAREVGERILKLDPSHKLGRALAKL